MSDSGPNLLPLHPSSLEGAEHHNPNSRVAASPEAFVHASAPVPRRQHPWLCIRPGRIRQEARLAFRGLAPGRPPRLAVNERGVFCSGNGPNLGHGGAPKPQTQTAGGIRELFDSVRGVVVESQGSGLGRRVLQRGCYNAMTALYRDLNKGESQLL